MDPINPLATVTDIDPVPKPMPTMAGWYLQTNVSGVSEESLPWMLAQGWEISGTNIDKTVWPWIITYRMRRTLMQNWQVLQTLLQDFTEAYNDGREANDVRYDDILESWGHILEKFQDATTEFTTDKFDDPTTGYITLLLGTVDSLESDYDAYKADVDSYDDTERANELTSLKTAWSTLTAEIQADITNVKASYDIDALVAKGDAAIAAFDTAVDAFNAAYSTLPTTLETDFTTHRTLTRSYLTDLGATELARINEQFDNLLANTRQELTNRGFYSSALTAQADARVERERSEAISSLNDRLAREKVENEHQLHGEHFQSRVSGLEASMKSMDASWKVVQATIQQADWSVDIRHRLLELEVKTELQLLDVQGRYYKLIIENVDWQDRRREQVYRNLVQVRLRQFELRSRTCEKEMELLRYHLDERNRLAIGLFGVMERRTDSYPDMADLAKLTTMLGDSTTSHWVAP